MDVIYVLSYNVDGMIIKHGIAEFCKNATK